MDWLRRNWPDLLIGVALVAVIAGIIATLISGGSFFPMRRGGGSTPAPQPTTPITGPTTPGATTPSTSAAGTQPTDPGQTPATATDPAGGAQGTEGTAGTGQEPATDPLPSGDGVAVLPPSSTPSTGSGTPAGTTGTDTSGGVTALPPSGAPTPSTPAATAPAATTPATTPAATTPTPSTPATPASASAEVASYRVSVGAFGNADNAQRLAQQFQEAGYPVLLGLQGSLTIVLVGPYATESEARTVANQIDAGNFDVVDPTVYRYVPDGDTGAAAPTAAPTAAPAAPAATTPAAPAAPVAPAAPATSATGRYLQVGAYANRESSLPQRTRLEGLGFSVTEVVEGDLLKLLVGPYQDQALSDAQSRLATNGIENFARGL